MLRIVAIVLAVALPARAEAEIVDCRVEESRDGLIAQSARAPFDLRRFVFDTDAALLRWMGGLTQVEAERFSIVRRGGRDTDLVAIKDTSGSFDGQVAMLRLRQWATPWRFVLLDHTGNIYFGMCEPIR